MRAGPRRSLAAQKLNAQPCHRLHILRGRHARQLLPHNQWQCACKRVQRLEARGTANRLQIWAFVATAFQQGPNTKSACAAECAPERAVVHRFEGLASRQVHHRWHMTAKTLDISWLVLGRGTAAGSCPFPSPHLQHMASNALRWDSLSASPAACSSAAEGKQLSLAARTAMYEARCSWPSKVMCCRLTPCKGTRAAPAGSLVNALQASCCLT